MSPHEGHSPSKIFRKWFQSYGDVVMGYDKGLDRPADADTLKVEFLLREAVSAVSIKRGSECRERRRGRSSGNLRGHWPEAERGPCSVIHYTALIHYTSL